MPSSASTCTTMSAPLRCVPASGWVAMSLVGWTWAFMVVFLFESARLLQLRRNRCRGCRRRIQPGHARTQSGADFFDRMIQIRLLVGLVVRQAGRVLGRPLARETAILNFIEHGAHTLLGRRIDNAWAARV